jgi:hypothetical protein
MEENFKIAFQKLHIVAISNRLKWEGLNVAYRKILETNVMQKGQF